MKTSIALVVFAASILAPAIGRCDQLRFTGNSRANIPLIKDALRNIQMVAQAKSSCESIEAVEAEVLPDDYKPAGGPYAEGSAKTQYESWQVTLCGRRERFLLATWQTPPEPGVMFRVGYPFPVFQKQ